MATNYSLIAEENIKRYGTDIDEYGPVLLSNRYSDRTHFVYELLQNAEDAIGWRLNNETGFSRDVTFDLDSRSLRFRHCGLPFGEEHVRGICNIGKGTKQQDLSAIGTHGIGFKSVYAYTRHPEVHSGDEHFVIDSFVRPCSVAATPTAIGETEFILPFDHPDVSEDEAHSEIAGRLQRLGLRTLLFLRNIDSIGWHLESGARGEYIREAKALRDGIIDEVTLLGQVDTGEVTEERWLVFRRPVSHHDQPAGFVEIAFLLGKDKKSSIDRIVAVPESPLVVFFPTEKETHFGFLIQGPYRTTPSRDNIPRDDLWNKHLIDETVGVFIWALSELRDLRYMDVGALSALVVDLQKYGPISQTAMFRPIVDALVNTLKSERLIPRFGGGHLPGSEAYLARSESLRTLISPSQLSEITGAASDWVASEISRDRTPALRSFLVDLIGATEIDAEDFVRDVSDEFLCRQSDDWLVEFYSFLLAQAAIRQRPWFATKKIVRLANGKHVAPFSPNATPNAYLPGPGETAFPTVKKSLCNGDGLKLLVQLGLKEPDPVDEVIRNVLPKYQKKKGDVSDASYEVDVRKVLAAFGTDSKALREKLIAALRSTTFIMSVNCGSGEKQLSTPGDVYLATDRLKKLFAGVHGVKLVDDDYPCLRGEAIRDLLEASGVIRHVRPIADNSITWDELRSLREQSGYAESSLVNDRVKDWTLQGLTRLLDALQNLSVAERVEKSQLLWEELAHLEERSGKSVFAGEYTWTHYGNRKAPPFDAAFIRVLNGTAWIPDANGDLQRPEFILFEALDWKPNPFLQSKIRFKPPVIESLAKEAGIEPGILDLLKKIGLTSVAELCTRLGLNEPSAIVGTKEGNGDEGNGNGGGVVDVIKDILGGTSTPTPPIDDPTGPERSFSGGGSGGGSKGGGHGGGPGTGPTGGKSSGTGGGGGENPGAKGGPGGGGTKPFISYVATHPNEIEHDPDGLQQEARMALEEQAISLILAREPQLKRTPTHNPGFDLFESNEAEEPIRRIEVKAMTGDLRGRPVGLSHTQFECAQKNGDAYWLYIVEHAGDAHNSRIVRIQDPAGKARTFCFDHGWISVAEVDTSVPVGEYSRAHQE